MDLEDLRHALDEAGSRTPVDVSNARAVVSVRARRRRRRQCGIASAALISGAIALVVVMLAIAGGGSSGHDPVVVIQPPASYESLPARGGAAMAYDAAHGQVVLFGGAINADPAFEETWLWDGHGWSHAHPIASPPARQSAVMAYDPRSQSVLMFGGIVPHVSQYSADPLDDMWSWDGANWKRLHPRHEPPWSEGLAMAYDPASKSVILLTLPSSHPKLRRTGNGYSVTGQTAFGTWQWDGSDWHELSTPAAPTFAVHGVLNDSPRLAPLLDGHGLLFYSFALDQSVCPSPDNICGGPPDVDGLRWSQTWTWDGHRWTEQHPSRAPGAVDLVAPFDGSPIAFATTPWRWTGGDWKETGASRGRGPGIGSAVWDQKEHAVVVYDGSETWTWNGTWVRREVAAPPTPTSTRTAPAPSASVAPIRACTSSQLQLVFDKDLGSVMQQPGAFFALRNVGSVPCTFDGYPAVQLFDVAGRSLAVHQSNGGSYMISDPGPRVVTLPPAGTVYFGIGWTDAYMAQGGTTNGCVSIGSASVEPPGSTHAVVVPARLGELFCPPALFVSSIAPKGSFGSATP